MPDSINTEELTLLLALKEKKVYLLETALAQKDEEIEELKKQADKPSKGKKKKEVS